MASFANNIRTLMHHQGYKPADIERMTGVSHMSVTAYMTGRYIPNSVNLCKLARCFNVSMDALWGDGR